MDTTSEKRPNLLLRLIWRIGGADPDILKTFPSDQSKFFIIGCLIIVTATFAGIGAFFALSMIYEPGIEIGAISFFWALVIFLVDRVVTTSINQSEYEVEEYWLLSRIFKSIRDIVPAVPRIFIALLLGMLVATPIQLKIFEVEVERKLPAVREERVTQQAMFLVEQYRPEVTRLRASLDANKEASMGLEAELKPLLAELQDARREHDLEIKNLNNDPTLLELTQRTVQEAQGGPLNSGRGTGTGDIFDSISAELEKRRQWVNATIQSKEAAFQQQASIIRQSIGRVEGEIGNYNQLAFLDEKHLIQIETRISTHKEEFRSNWETGITDYVSALYDAADEDTIVFRVMLAISMLIIVIEIAPVLSKLLSQRTAYDAFMDKERKIKKLKYQREFEELRKSKTSFSI